VNRFNLLFDLTPLGINKANAAAKKIYSFENSIYIQSIDKINLVNIYNMLGQEVESIRQPVSNIFQLHQTSGYYTVRIITDTCVYSQKIYLN